MQKLSYEDIIHLRRPVSRRHRPMPMIDRAAQFSPFAALVGYDAQIEETARCTEQRIELDESEKYILDQKQSLLMQYIADAPDITVTFFCPDDKKDGGRYVTVMGRLKKIHPCKGFMLLCDGTLIPLQDVISLESPLFERTYD